MSLFYQLMDTVGDGSGSTNMAVDGQTSGPITFKVSPGAGEHIKITRIMLYVLDTGDFDANKWGNNVDLINGFTFKTKIRSNKKTKTMVIQ